MTLVATGATELDHCQVWRAMGRGTRPLLTTADPNLDCGSVKNTFIDKLGAPAAVDLLNKMQLVVIPAIATEL